MEIDRPISRRAFLAAASAMALAGAGAAASQPAPPEAYPDRFLYDGGLVVLPSKGTLYVASDFHTRHADFQKWLKATSLIERLRNDKDTYGLIVGDAVDVKPGDPDAEKGGDSRIIDRIRQIQSDLGPDGKRLIFIQGNHESEVARIYGLLKTRFGMTDKTRRQFVAALYGSENGPYFQQFNFLERITDEQHDYLNGLPIAVLAGNGLVFVHASPAKTAQSPRDLAAKSQKIVDELVWSRPAEILEGGYTRDDLMAFLKRMADSRLLIVGHTPLSSLPAHWVQNGVGVYADHQLILATSYGWEPGRKSHLVLDLAKRYGQVKDVVPGRELLPLEPAAEGDRAAAEPVKARARRRAPAESAALG